MKKLKKNNTSILGDLLISLFIANSMAFLSFLIAVYSNFLLAGIFLFIGGSLVGVYFIRYSHRLILLSIFIITFGLLVLIPALDYRVLASGDIVEGVSVNLAPKHKDASAFIFTDVTVRREYMGSTAYSSKSTGGSTFYTYMVPLAPPYWTKDKPVPAWAVSSYGHFPTDFKAALATTYDISDDAVTNACERYGLTTNSDAPVLRLTQNSMEMEIDKAYKKLKNFVIILNVLWIVLFLIISLRSKNRN